MNKYVLLKHDWTSKYGTTVYKGPYPIRKINNNGTVQLQMDNILDTYNICAIKPYKT